MSGCSATFQTTNPFGDPTLSTIANVTLYTLDHVVWMDGEWSD